MKTVSILGHPERLHVSVEHYCGIEGMLRLLDQGMPERIQSASSELLGDCFISKFGLKLTLRKKPPTSDIQIKEVRGGDVV